MKLKPQIAFALMFAALFSLAPLSGCLEDIQRTIDPYYDIDSMYAIDNQTQFSIHYGYDISNQEGNATIRLMFPTGATKSAGATVKSLAGNPTAEWFIEGEVSRSVYVNYSGTQTLKIFEDANVSIQAAKSAKPGYLGDQYFNESTWLIMPSHPQIKALSAQILAGSTDATAYESARLIFKWLKENTIYKISASQLPTSPLDTLQIGGGDCDDLSFLYISLCKAAGIPARFVSGYIVRETGLEAHAWVEFYAGGWIPVEAAGIGGQDSGLDWELNGNFGVFHPDHVALFTDDGSNASLSIYSNVKLYYFTQKATIEQIEEGTITVPESAKLVIYKDGHREIKAADWEPEFSFKFW
ncbi:MAG: transglutaminase-like domain-containing protein [Candidatus Thermoplasmatota archaeon]|nr:transglutaminase-like domain-containing protein [Candidatus Thermoplasmatota archaeon]